MGLIIGELPSQECHWASAFVTSGEFENSQSDFAWKIYFDDIEIDGNPTFNRQFQYMIQHLGYNMIPKVTFDFIAVRYKDYCGVETIQGYYRLKCANATLEFLNSMKTKFVKGNLLFLIKDTFIDRG